MALVALACREAFPMRSRQVMAQAAAALARPSPLDRWLAALPPAFVRDCAMADAAARLPGLDGEKARAWLGKAIGVDFETHPARAFGVMVGRIFPVDDDDGRGRFDWAPPARSRDELTGRRAILVPDIGDVVALDPDRAGQAWSLSGDLDPLGWHEPALADELAKATPIVAVARDPLSWIAHLMLDEAGGVRSVIADAPAIAILDWRSTAVDMLLRRPGLHLACTDPDHADWLHRALKTWRRAHTPALPTVAIIEAAAAA